MYSIYNISVIQYTDIFLINYFQTNSALSGNGYQVGLGAVRTIYIFKMGGVLVGFLSVMWNQT